MIMTLLYQVVEIADFLLQICIFCLWIRHSKHQSIIDFF